MNLELLERRLRELYQVELVDPDPPIASLRERVVAIPESRPRIMPTIGSRRLVPAFIAIAFPLAALVGLALLAGAQNHERAVEAGRITFVQATYGCGAVPCRLPPAFFGVGGLRAERPVVVITDPKVGAPARLVDVPGRTHPVGGWTVADPRNGRLAGPAVRWSPDGTQLAFRLFNDVPGIYLVDRDGSSLRLLVDLPGDLQSGMGFSPALAWSPDATRIAYTYPYGGMQSPLRVVDTVDGSVTDLGVKGTRAVAWSPDGTRIAFAQSDARNGSAAVNVTRLFVIGVDGKGLTQLSAAEAADYHVNALAWSPDGTRIAFELVTDSRASARDRTGIYTIKPDGSDLLRLTRTVNEDVGDGCCIHLSHDVSLSWSPDGQRIAGLGHALGLGEPGIIVANADGSGFRVVTSRRAYHLDWSPDGSQLVYAVALADLLEWSPDLVVPGDPWSAIYVIDADGSDERWLADGEFPDWSP